MMNKKLNEAADRQQYPSHPVVVDSLFLYNITIVLACTILQLCWCCQFVCHFEAKEGKDPKMLSIDSDLSHLMPAHLLLDQSVMLWTYKEMQQLDKIKIYKLILMVYE